MVGGRHLGQNSSEEGLGLGGQADPGNEALEYDGLLDPGGHTCLGPGLAEQQEAQGSNSCINTNRCVLDSGEQRMVFICCKVGMCLYFPIYSRLPRRLVNNSRSPALHAAGLCSLMTPGPQVTSKLCRLNPECFHDRGAWPMKCYEAEI